MNFEIYKKRGIINTMDIIIVLAILIFSAVLHEVMHGFVAEKLGDPTPRLLGRLTLNPLPHLDPIMSVLLPLTLYLSSGFFFAAAKPVPINPLHLKEGKKDLALVALAGPLTNIGIAVLFALLFNLGLRNMSFINQMSIEVIRLNLFLGILNLIPIPPLDGAKVFSVVLPDKIAYQYNSIGNIGIFILFFLLFFPVGPFNLGALLNQLLLSFLRLLGI